MKKHKLLTYILITWVMTLQVSFAKEKTEKKEDSLLKSMCIIGFNYEMELANKVPPKGMSDFTCECFLDEFNLGTNLDKAQEKCKDKASSIFDL